MFEFLAILVLIIGAILWIPYVMRTNDDGAPYVPMEPEIVERSLKLAEIKPGDVFYELGSGDGRVVTGAALKGARAVGIEIDKLRAWYSNFWLKLLRVKNAQIINKNFFDVDLRDADIVFTYLLEETNQKLEEKLKRELKPGTRVIGVGFPFPDWNPVKVDPRGPIYGPIHLYKI